jgi:hypothetical protein
VITPGFNFEYSQHENCCGAKTDFCNLGISVAAVSTETYVFV